VAVFVDGCFWHGCPCKYLPRTNTAFWRNKIENNKRRDRRVSQALRREGWSVIRVKECAVRKAATLTRIAKIVAAR
jgi:DNA mismatch endonuclease (patch repair protein)